MFVLLRHRILSYWGMGVSLSALLSPLPPLAPLAQNKKHWCWPSKPQKVWHLHTFKAWLNLTTSVDALRSADRGCWPNLRKKLQDNGPLGLDCSPYWPPSCGTNSQVNLELQTHSLDSAVIWRLTYSPSTLAHGIYCSTFPTLNDHTLLFIKLLWCLVYLFFLV